MQKHDTRIENIYPLSPMQEGILFHALYSGNAGVYLNQLTSRFRGPLNIPVFQQVWSELVRRHPALRTAFVPTPRARWMQVVHQLAELKWEQLDWSKLPDQSIHERFAAWLMEDRKRGLELDHVPLMRMTLIQFGERDYQFVWSHHHALLDGWSIAIVVREAFQLYSAACRKQEPDLRPAPPFSDYFLWRQRNQEPGGEAYWRTQLSGVTSPTRLGVERKRTQIPGPTSSSQKELLLSESMTRTLEQLAATHRVTLSTLFHALWGLLLYKYSGEQEVMFGTTVAGRPPDLPGAEHIVGLFIHTVPVLLRLAPEESVVGLAQRLQSSQIELRQYEQVPLEVIQACSGVPRGTPLLNSIVVFENYPVAEAAGQLPRGLKVEDVHFHEVTNYSMTAVVVPGQRLRLRLQYDPNQYDAGAVQRILEACKHLLDQMAASPFQPVNELSLTGELPCRQAENLPPRLAQAECIPALFERQVEKAPEAIAVQYDGQTFTYRELNRHANRLARYLRNLNVGPEIRVALCLERGLAFTVSILGVLKAGGAYVPVDPEYPPERLDYMFSDMGATVLLTEEKLLPRFAQQKMRLVCWEQVCNETADYEASNLETLCFPGNMAYMIYTSGSTGQPKGVMVSHENVTRLFQATQPTFSFGSNDVWTLFHSFSFDFSVWELWGALLYGGRVIVVPYDTSRSPAAMYDLLSREGVTVYNQTPSSFLELVRYEESSADRLPLRLRAVIFGGEALEISRLAPWVRIHGDQYPMLVNMYGITETTVHVTEKRLTQAEIEAGMGSLIGVPISDLKVHVLDQSLHPVPDGVSGEMLVGGAGVSRGYHGRPELTAQVFVPDPYSGIPGGRLYRSGDIARYSSESGLEYLGRRDYQVKIRGHRIELGEIRSILEQHPDVRECVVTARKEQNGHNLLAAYAVLKTGSTLQSYELRDYARSKLPGYIVPAHFMVLSALPLTAHGKVNYHALPAPEIGREDLKPAFAPPVGELELKLAQIWREVLHCPAVGVDDNYFELGGDSIRSLEIIAKAKMAGIQITPKQIFESQTIRLLARQAGPRQAGAAESNESFQLVSREDRDKLPAGIEDAYPLILLQKGMVLHGQVPGSSCYHDIFSFHLRCPLQKDLLEKTLAEVVSRHPVLRTSFNLSDFQEPMQLVHASAPSNLLFSEISHLSSGKQDAFLEQWMEDERNTPIDWSQAPLFRVYIWQRGWDTFQFVFSFHHAILDGWSVGSILAELFSYYANGLRGISEEKRLPVRASFRQFVALEKAALESDESGRFWRSKLENLPSCRLPRMPLSDGYHLRFRAAQSAIASLKLEPKLCCRIEQLARTLQVSIKHVLLAAHVRVLNTIYGQSDVVTGMVMHGRPEEEDGSRAVGLFLNTVPLHIRASGGSWKDLIRQAMAEELECMPYRRFPLAEMCRRFNRPAPFECVFAFNHFHVYRSLKHIPGIEVLQSHVFEQTSLPLGAIFNLDPESSLLILQLNYHTSEFSAGQVQRMSQYYLQALRAMTSDPEREYHLVSLLTEAERRQLELEWNNTAVDPPELPVLHSWFEAQAVRRPSAKAITSEHGHLAYAELDRRANRLAHLLRQNGLRPDQIAGIWLTRDISMIVSLLAVLKAGGAFLPLDPAYPRERVRVILEDSKAALLITKSEVAVGFSSSCPIIRLDRAEDELALCPEHGCGVKVYPENLAYVTYTSGSTGKPKGVMIDHRSICNTLRWRQTAFELSVEDRILQNISLTFDPAVWQIFGALVTGCELVLAQQDGQHAIPVMAGMIERHQITITDFVPSLLKLFLDEADMEQCHSLKKVFCGGEALTSRVTGQFMNASSAELFNMYGPTEACIDTTWWPCTADDAGPVPIGRPISNKKVYVLDQHQMPVPAGVGGELYIGGAGLARGYLNHPALTAERFIPDPFGAPGGRLYRTGDLVRFRAEGILEYLGRLDEQVKVHGARIELGEIEHVLANHPDVKECTLMLHGSTESEKQLVAYVVTDNPDLLESELRRYLKESLPLYMVPSRYIRLKTLPLNHHGKVDPSLLPEPSPENESTDMTRVAPRTELEEQVASVWRTVLKRNDVGVKDNFFDLGGHSLAMLQVHSKLQKLLPHDLSVIDMFGLPTVEALAGYLGQKVNSPPSFLARSTARARAAGAALQRQRAQRQSKKQLTERDQR